MDPRRIVAAGLLLGVTVYGILFASRDAACAADVDQSKLVGKWVLTKANGGEGAIPTSYEFTAKGDVTYSFGRQTWKGTYKVKASKLTLRFAPPRGKPVTRSLTIKNLADDVLVIKDGGNELEFKKK
jgi:uncharacterized protein (TIGR03066 family)